MRSSGCEGASEVSADKAGQLLSLALKQLQIAIDLLDLADAPAHIAAHVDLATHQLVAAIESPDQHLTAP